MARFDKGVSWYSIGKAEVVLSWPENAVCCRYCRFLHKDAIDRYWCRLTDGMVYNIDCPPDGCPAEMIVVTDDEYSSFCNKEIQEMRGEQE